MAKIKLPKQLNICLVASKFSILSRASDLGFLWPIAKGLVKAGHQVTIIAARGNLNRSFIERDGVKVYYLHEGHPNLSHLSFGSAALRKFIELHRVTPFHILHSIDASGLKIAEHKKEFDIAVAYDADATQMSQIISILGMSQETVGSLLSTGLAVAYKFLTTYYSQDRRLLKTADGIFVASPQQRIILERYYLYPDYHMYTVPYAMDVGNLATRETMTSLKQQLGIPESSQVLVTVSDMNETSDLSYILRAFEKVATKKSGSYLIIVGNGPKWKDIEYEMLSLALGRRVLMVGAVKDQDLPDYIGIADVFINISSRTSGFEPSLIEAMAQAKVVIGSEVSAMTSIIEDNVDGFLVRPADTIEIASLIVKIFSSEISATEVGSRAREKVLKLFDMTSMINTVENAYKEILIKAKPRRLRARVTETPPPGPSPSAI